MKNLIQMVFMLIASIHINTQEKVIQTKSVTIENLIPFIVEKYASISNENITLLFEFKNNLVILEAIAVLPELIAIIKDWTLNQLCSIEHD